MLGNKEFDIFSFISGFLTCMSIILFYFILNSCQSMEHLPRVNNVYAGRMGSTQNVQRCTGGSEACKTQNSNNAVINSGRNTHGKKNN